MVPTSVPAVLAIAGVVALLLGVWGSGIKVKKLRFHLHPDSQDYGVKVADVESIACI